MLFWTQCSTTVCAKGWLQEYLNLLSDYKGSLIVEQTFASTFSFGDSASVESANILTIPCLFGNMRSEITTYIVKCEIPLFNEERKHDFEFPK